MTVMGPGKMKAQSGKCLSQKYKDQGLIPRMHLRKPDMVALVGDPIPGKAEMHGFLGSLSSQLYSWKVSGPVPWLGTGEELGC